MTPSLVRTSLLAAAALSAAVLFPAPAARAAGDSSLRMEVLVDGRPIAEHLQRSTTYVEALRGREYSLRITNLEPVRVAVAVSVDGRNSIDAKRTSARDARKWILEPYESIVLDGWQTSQDTARRFYFSDERGSYAAWLGDVSQAGVIEAVSYRERQRQPVATWDGPRYEPRAGSQSKADAHEGRADGPADALGSAAPAPQRDNGAAGARSQRPPAEAEMMRKDEDDNAATGIGRELGHDVVRVAFDAESTPAGRARIRYEFRSALVSMGVLPAPPDRTAIARRERASGFTDWCPTP